MIDVYTVFKNHIIEMLNDLEIIQSSNLMSPSIMYHTDSTTLEGIYIEDTINCVITSPPYPNRYSYVWNTRPHLYFLDFFQTPREASDLDKATIGGTWGTATSILDKGVIAPENEIIKKIISPLIEKIRVEDNLMANYVMKYFNLLARQISKMEELPNQNLRCAYVVGNSRIKGTYIETDVLLGQIFSGLGYNVKSIDRIRKRNSGKDLHESIVYVRKN